jgi:hypothetical protein
VTSSRCRCVGGTIARFTAAAMKPHGGLRPRLIRELSPASCGLARIRCPTSAEKPHSMPQMRRAGGDCEHRVGGNITDHSCVSPLSSAAPSNV